MKRISILAASAVILLSAACSGHKSGSASSGADSGSPAVSAPVTPPANGDWSQVVTPTKQGGFLMGNPNAKVHLIEFGSLTCPHCREFNQDGVPSLVADYVKPGKVSYEFRNYVRDPYDITAALITRCNGAKSFFPLTDAMYNTQADWIAKIQAVPKDQQESLQNVGPDQESKVTTTIANWAGFQQWAAMRGVPTAKVNQCLTDQAAVNQLVQMNSDATNDYPDMPGTPTFIVNGKMVDIKAGATPPWQQLQAVLNQALGH